MKKKFMVLYLSIIVSLCLIISSAVLFYVQYQSQKMISEQKKYAAERIEQYIHEFDKDLFKVESSIVAEYSGNLSKIYEDILDRGTMENISEADLRNIADKYNVDEIYLVNKEGVIYKSTFKNDLNLNLRKVSGKMSSFLDGVYGKGYTQTHRALVSDYNKLNKYLYFSPKNSNYIIEISIDVKNYIASKYDENYANYLFIDGLQKYVRQNIYLKDVEIYDVTNYVGRSILLSSKKINDCESLLDKVKLNSNYQITTGGKTIVYNLLSDNKEEETYYGKDLLVEMVYDFSSINKFGERIIIFSFVTGFLLIALVFIIFSRLFQTIVGKRIVQINHNLNQLGKGIYPKDIIFENKDEITEIANNINTMKNRIKEREDELKNNVLELERMAEALKESQGRIEYDNLKTEFFANLSHEFKTPLNILLSSLQLIELLVKNETIHDTDKKLSYYTKIMRQNSYRLLRLVNNLIDLTRIDAYFFEIDLHNYDIVKIVEDVVLSTVEYGKVKNIKIEFKKYVDSKVIACDPDKIERILLNLISNAIKFTDEFGSIEIAVKENGTNIYLYVKDNGIGIPSDKLDDIFQRFRQVDKSFTRNAEGSGIGLSLVKALVDLHNGQVYVISEVGRGSEFIVSLPVVVLDEECLENPLILNQDRTIEKMRVEFSDIYS